MYVDEIMLQTTTRPVTMNYTEIFSASQTNHIVQISAFSTTSPNTSMETSSGQTHHDANDSRNGTEEDGFGMNSAVKLAAILVPTFFSLIFLLGVVGNSLVITVTVKLRQSRRPPARRALGSTNMFILNLAIADLLFLFFCVPFQASVYTLQGWPFGAFICVFSEFCQKVSMLASIYTMVALSLDRYFAVAKATSARQWRTSRNALYCLITVWVLSIALGIPAFFTRRQIAYQNVAICLPNDLLPVLYNVYIVLTFVLGYLLPLLLVFFCYLGVLRHIMINARRNLAVNKKKSEVTRKHVTKVVLLVVLGFALCWFPYHLFALWVLSMGDDFEYNMTSFLIKMIAHCLSYANSCFNPIIYAFMSQEFRKGFKNAFTCSNDFGTYFNSFRQQVRQSRFNLRQSFAIHSEDNPKVYQPRTPTTKSKTCTQSLEQEKNSKHDTSCSTCILTLTPLLSRKNEEKEQNLTNLKFPNHTSQRKEENGNVIVRLDEKQNSKTLMNSNETDDKVEWPETGFPPSSSSSDHLRNNQYQQSSFSGPDRNKSGENIQMNETTKVMLEVTSVMENGGKISVQTSPRSVSEDDDFSDDDFCIL